ncbi:MAG: cytochrome C biogenesis protein, partial [Nitrosopumilus sp.]|nr:cytochrome C biogenesis protein [Nitrosopumilus sp.]
LGVVHGVGRAIPLILMSVLAVLGINATKSLTVKRESIERASGWMLIIIGAFLIINGLPEGHEWYEETFIHKGWNNLIEMTPIPSEFGMDEHDHGHGDVQNFKSFYTVLLAVLILSPIFVRSVRKLREMNA